MLGEIETAVFDMTVHDCEVHSDGQVAHHTFLDYFQRGRVEQLRTHGISIPALARDNCHLNVLAIQVQFYGPLRRGDQFRVFTEARRSREIIYFKGLICRLPDNARCSSSTIELVMVKNGEAITDNILKIADLATHPFCLKAQ